MRAKNKCPHKIDISETSVNALTFSIYVDDYFPSLSHGAFEVFRLDAPRVEIKDEVFVGPKPGFGKNSTKLPNLETSQLGVVFSKSFGVFIEHLVQTLIHEADQPGRRGE